MWCISGVASSMRVIQLVTYCVTAGPERPSWRERIVGWGVSVRVCSGSHWMRTGEAARAARQDSSLVWWAES